MPSRPRLIALPMLFVSVWAVSGCAGPRVQVRPLFPAAVDLAVEPKPAPPADIVTGAQAAAEYDIAVEGWGERSWLAVARVCRWAVENGAEGLNCPVP